MLPYSVRAVDAPPLVLLEALLNSGRRCNPLIRVSSENEVVHFPREQEVIHVSTFQSSLEYEKKGRKASYIPGLAATPFAPPSYALKFRVLPL